MTEEQVNELERSHGLISDGVQHTKDVLLLVAEVRRLKEALQRYRRHLTDCWLVNDLTYKDARCTCGLDDALE